MTQAAFAAGNAGSESVKAFLRRDILAHRFVTAQAQLRFALVFAVSVTFLALAFIFRMRTAQRAGAEHAFEIEIDSNR